VTRPVNEISRRSVSELDLLGQRPTGATMVGQAMKDRILILSSLDLDLFVDEEVNEEEIVPCQWNRQSVEELASLYQAGPVLYLSDCDLDEDVKENLLEIDSKTTINGSSQDSRDVWTVSTIKTHAKIARIVSDWFSMLASFNYI
jgi:hypothetical protein